MQHSVCKLILMLAIVTLLGAIPAIAVERPFGLSGSGNVEFEVDEEGNVLGGHITASGIATHLGPWTQDGDLEFVPRWDPASS